MAEAQIIDQGGGIGRVEWRVNGVTLGLEDVAVKDLPPAGQPLTVRRSLSLEPGENRVEVLAYNAKGLITSDPASTTLRWDGKAGAGAPRLYVVSVGVNDYWDSRLRLSYAVPDAKALADGFRQSGGGLYGSVEVTTVLDADVTAAHLDRVFADLAAKCGPTTCSCSSSPVTARRWTGATTTFRETSVMRARTRSPGTVSARTGSRPGSRRSRRARASCSTTPAKVAR